MRIEGYIYGLNNEPVKAVVSLVSPDTSVQVVEVLPGEKYFIDAVESDLRALTIIFSSKGYKSISVTGAELIDSGPNIHLEKTNTLFLLFVAMGLFYALYSKKKKVGALTVEKIKPFLLIAGSVVGFTLLQQLLQKLGIWKTTDERTLDAAATDVNSWWNPEFWKSKPLSVSYTSPITLSTAQLYARQIYDSFNWLNDCEECAKAVFKRLPSQAAGSYVSFAFNTLFGMDLLDFLRGGVWPQDRLSSADINEINRYVLSLPKY